MRIPPYKIRTESRESQTKAGRYNPGLELVIGRKRKDEWTGKTQRTVIPIAAGTHDDIDVRIIGGDIYVLTRNHGLGYVGLEVFNKAGEQIGDIFAQSDEQAECLIGSKGIDYSAPYCIRALSQYI